MATSEVNPEPPENNEGAPPEGAQPEEDDSRSKGINDPKDSKDGEEDDGNKNQEIDGKQNQDDIEQDDSDQGPSEHDGNGSNQGEERSKDNEPQTAEEKEEQRLQGIKERVENLPCYPPFTTQELSTLKVSQLKEILEYWGVTCPTNTRKPSLIAKIRGSPCNIAPGWVSQLRGDDLPLPAYSEEILSTLTDDDVAKISGIIWPEDDDKEYTADQLREYLLGLKQDFKNKDLTNIGAADLADLGEHEDSEQDADGLKNQKKDETKKDYKSKFGPEAEPVGGKKPDDDDDDDIEMIEKGQSVKKKNTDTADDDALGGSPFEFDVSGIPSANHMMTRSKKQKASKNKQRANKPRHTNSDGTASRPGLGDPSWTFPTAQNSAQASWQKTIDENLALKVMVTDLQKQLKQNQRSQKRSKPKSRKRERRKSLKERIEQMRQELMDLDKSDDSSGPSGSESSEDSRSSDDAGGGSRKEPNKYLSVIKGLMRDKTKKCKIEISGADDEDFFKKICEIERWMKVYEVGRDSMYRYLVTTGLTDRAKEQFEAQWMGNKERVQDLPSLLQFLMDKFNAHRSIDQYYKRAARQKQGDEQPLQYYHNFITKLQTYNAAVTQYREYTKHPDSMVTKVPEDRAYVIFINSLNKDTAEHVRNYVSLRGITKTLENIRPAVKHANDMLYEGHGIRNRRNKEERGYKEKKKAFKKKFKEHKKSKRRDRYREDRDYETKKFRKRSNRNRSYRKSGRRDRKRTSNDASYKKDKVTCYLCGEEGHFKSECPEAKKHDKNDRNKGTTPRKSKPKINFINTPSLTREQTRRFHREEDGGLDSVNTRFLVTLGDRSNTNCKDSSERGVIVRRGVSGGVRKVKVTKNSLRRYIYALNTANTTNTEDLDPEFTTELIFKGFASKRESGGYLALLDTGSNTPAMKTSFVQKQGFPIYAVKRPFDANTAGGTVIINHATVLDVETKDRNGDKFWMKSIFYLLDDTDTDIIVSRRLMRLLGYTLTELGSSSFRHPAKVSHILDEYDHIFYDQLLDVDDLPNVGYSSHDDSEDSDYHIESKEEQTQSAETKPSRREQLDLFERTFKAPTTTSMTMPLSYTETDHSLKHKVVNEDEEIIKTVHQTTEHCNDKAFIHEADYQQQQKQEKLVEPDP